VGTGSSSLGRSNQTERVYGTRQRPRPIVVVDDAGVELGQVAAGQHQELALLLDCGFRLIAEVDRVPDSGQPVVMVRAVLE
jgi:hypothetical protein